MNRRLAALTYHEAGHAVVSFALELPVLEISVIADDARGSLGHVSHENFYHGRSPDIDMSAETLRKAEAHVMSALAGDIAVAIWSPRVHARLHDGNAAGTEHDNDIAMHLLFNLSGSEYEAVAHLKLLKIRTINLLTMATWWNAVEVLAAQLTKQCKLDGETVLKVIESACDSVQWSDDVEKRMQAARKRLSKKAL